MKIARVVKSDKETFGLVKDGKIATKDDITHSTGTVSYTHLTLPTIYSV